MNTTGFTLCFDLMEQVGKEVGIERERLAEVAEKKRKDALEAEWRDFATMELPIPFGMADNCPAKTIPEHYPNAGDTWCCLAIDTNENLGWEYEFMSDDWDEEDTDRPSEDEFPDAIGYRFLTRDDALYELAVVGDTPNIGGSCRTMNTQLVGEFEDACEEFSFECIDAKASVDEMIALANSWGIDVYVGDDVSDRVEQ